MHPLLVLQIALGVVSAVGMIVALVIAYPVVFSGLNRPEPARRDRR